MNIPSEGFGFKVPTSFIHIVLDFTISQCYGQKPFSAIGQDILRILLFKDGPVRHK